MDTENIVNKQKIYFWNIISNMTPKFTCLVMPAAGLQLQATDAILHLPNQTCEIQLWPAGRHYRQGWAQVPVTL